MAGNGWCAAKWDRPGKAILPARSPLYKKRPLIYYLTEFINNSYETPCKSGLYVCMETTMV
jgi:hypothetical protein